MFIAFCGVNTGFNWNVSPTAVNVFFVTSKAIPVTRSPTVTSQDAVLFPSSVVTVILAVPVVTAVTSPFSSTVAASGLDDSQVTFLFVAFSGATVAVNCRVSPTWVSVALVLFSSTLSTDAAGAVNCTSNLSITGPAFASAVNTSSPAPAFLTTIGSSTVLYTSASGPNTSWLPLTTLVPLHTNAFGAEEFLPLL